MSTFNPEKWIAQSHDSEDTKTITVAGETAKIRRLTGMQWEHYARALNGASDDSSIAVLLYYGLVKPHGQYTYEEMAKLYDTCPVVADKLAMAILEHTMQRMSAERKVLEDAEKNSETTPASPPSDDGAESMGKTLKKPKSAEPN